MNNPTREELAKLDELIERFTSLNKTFPGAKYGPTLKKLVATKQKILDTKAAKVAKYKKHVPKITSWRSE